MLGVNVRKKGSGPRHPLKNFAVHMNQTFFLLLYVPANIPLTCLAVPFEQEVPVFPAALLVPLPIVMFFLRRLDHLSAFIISPFVC